MCVAIVKPVSRLLVIAAAAATVACATPAARDIGGRWVPLNRFADAPQAIPLRQGYVYQATPVDGTLKAMLERWARDSKRELSYQHSHDYTLHAQAARVHAHDIASAAAALTAAYSGEGVRISADADRIVVIDARGAQAGPATSPNPTD